MDSFTLPQRVQRVNTPGGHKGGKGGVGAGGGVQAVVPTGLVAAFWPTSQAFGHDLRPQLGAMPSLLAVSVPGLVELGPSP